VRWHVSIILYTQHFDVAELQESRNRCSSRKESRKNVKKEIRRMKKQLFGVKRRRKKMKSRRQRRSVLPSLFNADWIFGQSDGNDERKEKEIPERPPAKQLKVNTQLEIARKQITYIPSDFFQVVTSSDIKHSPFSGHQTSTIVKSSNSIANKAVEKKDYKYRKRNYKRQKLLFNSPSGTLSDSAGCSCPAYQE
jgi:hypothetical protein